MLKLLPRKSSLCASFCRHLTLSVGSILKLERNFSKDDVVAFGQVSHDRNPMHFDEEVAASSQFKKPVVHGMLVASMFSALIGNSVPGSIYLSQNLKWVQPVYFGDCIVAKVEVLELKKLRQSAVLAIMSTTCTNQNNVVVLEGTASCRLPAESTA